MTLEEKWSSLIEIAKKYWIDSEPTGISDEEFDKLEHEAALDGFFVRDFVIDKYLKGTRTKNQYISKFKKFKVEGISMLEAMKKSAEELGIPEDEAYYPPKYDGSSLAIYIDPHNGRPHRVVTVGNLNTEDYGVDQTWKLLKLLPKSFPLGIKALQCEALIDLNRLSSDERERARQKANGLINSKYCDSEVSSLLTLRAYRYYLDDSYYGQKLQQDDYKDVLYSLPVIKSPIDGHITFAPAEVWSLEDLIRKGGDFTEHDIVDTKTGKFMADGYVLYNKQGQCQRALKFAGAGSGSEAIKTTVRGIQWNDQNEKGKDSWSANVIIDPVNIKGCVIKKPSAGSVSKLIKNNISVGAEIGIILANSTIPMVGNIFKPGNGDFMWPTCNCGYTLSGKDIFGSLIKCGNPNCSERIKRMRASITDKNNINLDTLLVIDRFKWENTTVDMSCIKAMILSDNKQGYHDYLISFLKSDLQKRNLELVWEASWTVLKEVWSI